MSPSAPTDPSKWSTARAAHQRGVSKARERASEKARQHEAHDSVAHEALVSLRSAEGEVRKAR
jgi:hypothetical protein